MIGVKSKQTSVYSNYQQSHSPIERETFRWERTVHLQGECLEINLVSVIKKESIHAVLLTDRNGIQGQRQGNILYELKI